MLLNIYFGQFLFFSLVFKNYLQSAIVLIKAANIDINQFGRNIKISNINLNCHLLIIPKIFQYFLRNKIPLWWNGWTHQQCLAGPLVPSSHCVQQLVKKCLGMEHQCCTEELQRSHGSLSLVKCTRGNTSTSRLRFCSWMLGCCCSRVHQIWTHIFIIDQTCQKISQTNFYPFNLERGMPLAEMDWTQTRSWFSSQQADIPCIKGPSHSSKVLSRLLLSLMGKGKLTLAATAFLPPNTKVCSKSDKPWPCLILYGRVQHSRVEAMRLLVWYGNCDWNARKCQFSNIWVLQKQVKTIKFCHLSAETSYNKKC